MRLRINAMICCHPCDRSVTKSFVPIYSVELIYKSWLEYRNLYSRVVGSSPASATNTFQVKLQ